MSDIISPHTWRLSNTVITQQYSVAFFHNKYSNFSDDCSKCNSLMCVMDEGRIHWLIRLYAVQELVSSYSIPVKYFEVKLNNYKSRIYIIYTNCTIIIAMQIASKLIYKHVLPKYGDIFHEPNVWKYILQCYETWILKTVMLNKIYLPNIMLIEP